MITTVSAMVDADRSEDGYEHQGSAMTPDGLSNLIGVIYDCVLDNSQWEPALGQIAAAFECSVASLTVNDLKRDRFLINRASGWDHRLFDVKSNRHLPEINARLQEWLETRPDLDEPFVSSRDLPPQYVEQSRYADECLKPQRIVDIMHLFLTYTPDQFSELGLGRDADRGTFSEAEVDLARLFVPHLRRAITIGNVLDLRSIESAQKDALLDRLKCGVIVINAARTILHANEAAETILRRGDPLLSRQGKIDAKWPTAGSALRDAIAKLTADPVRCDTAGLAIRLTGSDDEPTFAHVLPLSTGDLCTRLVPGASAAIFLGASLGEDAAQVVGLAYGLTPTEMRLLEGLLSGCSLAEAASNLGISINTAKTHLARVFSKTGVSRQTELIRLATKLTSPARAETRPI